MTFPEQLAALNATLNGAAGVCLVAGYAAVRAKKVRVHRALMLAAFTISSLFLVSYLTRYAIAGDRKFDGEGLARVGYLTLLASHVLLAISVPPLAIRLLFLALKNRVAEHRKLAKVAFPIWLYVSVTGVIVYLILY